MTDDIVTNLRHEAAQCSASPCVGCTNLLAAADEIERLRAVIRELQMLIAIEADMAVDEALAKKEARRG